MHLCVISLSLKEIEMKFCQNCLFSCLYPDLFKKTVFARGPPDRCPRPTSGPRPTGWEPLS